MVVKVFNEQIFYHFHKLFKISNLRQDAVINKVIANTFYSNLSSAAAAGNLLVRGEGTY
jgi:hypothetical protein